MRKKIFFWTIGIVTVFIFVISSALASDYRPNKWIRSTTPTIFVHGWGSSVHAEEGMVNTARMSGVTNTIVRATVSKDGQVSFSGPVFKKARNPIVMVNLQNNRQGSPKQGGTYVKNVITGLQQRDHIKRYNLVGHSMGNDNNFAFLNDYGNDQSLPKLNKQVVLAGSGISNNKKDPYYQAERKQFGNLKNVYPHAAVLNIVGNIGHGKHSDGVIPNSTSFAVKQMLGNRPRSYQLKVIHGKNAQHSRLHENKHVFSIINNFLWGK